LESADLVNNPVDKMLIDLTPKTPLDKIFFYDSIVFAV